MCLHLARQAGLMFCLFTLACECSPGQTMTPEAPIPNLAISNALRLSLVGWSKTLASEVAKDGITANVVVPGRIATDRIEFLDQAKAKREGRSVEDVRAENAASIPLGRLGKPEEYGAMVAFLASEPAAYITGSIFRVDGGMIASI